MRESDYRFSFIPDRLFKKLPMNIKENMLTNKCPSPACKNILVINVHKFWPERITEGLSAKSETTESISEELIKTKNNKKETTFAKIIAPV